MDQSTACHCRYLLDGGHALSAAAVRLSLRGRTRLEAVGNLQGDGAAAAPGAHYPRDDRDLARLSLSGLCRPLVFSAVVSRQVSAGADPVGRPRLFCPMG